MTATAETARRITAFARKFARKRAAETAYGRTARVLFAPLRRGARRREYVGHRILVVERVLRIGDTLVARPALAALRARRPGAEVAVVCHPALAPLCRADALVDCVTIARPGRAGFLAAAAAARAFRAPHAFVFVTDRFSPYLAWLAGARDIVGYDYAARGVALTDRRTAPPRANVPAFLYPPDAPVVPAADIWLRLADADAPSPPRYPPLEPGPAAREGAARLLAATGLAGKKPLVILHPGAANPSYLWPSERWSQVGRELARGGARLIITGNTAEKDAAAATASFIGPGVVVAAGELSLLETFALVAAADLVVSLDTAPVHIAATMGTPVVGLYGPGDETMWAPRGVPARVLTGPTPCRGCKTARCFQDRHYCMEAIRAEAVVTAAEELLVDGKS